MTYLLKIELIREFKSTMRKVFENLKLETKNKKIYSFGFIFSQDMNNLYPVANTLEDLNETAKSYYSEEESNENWKFEDELIALKWAYSGDWKYFGYQEEEFKIVNEIIDKLAKPYYKAYCEKLPEKDFEKISSKVYDDTIGTIKRTLRELDEEGLFGKDEQRNNFILAVFIDFPINNDEVLCETKSLNPEKSYLNLYREIKKS